MAKVTLEDPWGNQMSMTCFPDSWIKLQEGAVRLLGKKYKFEPGIGIHVNGDLQWFEGNLSLIFTDITYAVPAPEKPEDLKPRKVSMPKLRIPKEDKQHIEENDVINKWCFCEEGKVYIEEIEDQLIESGIVDYSNEIENDEDM